MKIEVRDNQAFFEIRPGEKVYVSFGSTEVEVGTTLDTTLGEMALVVTIPGDYTHNRVDLGRGKYETRFVVTGPAARKEEWEEYQRWKETGFMMTELKAARGEG